jgi:hypothetical protein
MYANIPVSSNVEQMKNCIHDMQLQNRMSKYDSFDGDLLIDKYIKSDNDVNLYLNPGEAPYRTVKAKQYLGRVVGFNSKKNWVKIYAPVFGKELWSPYKEGIFYITGYVGEATEKELADAKKTAINTIKNSIPSTSKVGLNVAEGVGDVVDTSLSVVNFVGKNLKWILIGAIVIFVIYVTLQLKK